MIPIETILLIIGFALVTFIFLPGYSQILGRRFGQGFMQGVNQEFDNQFDHFMKMQETKKPVKKESENG